MNLVDFLKLPKVKSNYNDRLTKEIKLLKKSITLDSSLSDYNMDKKCCGKRTFETRHDALDNISKTGKNSKYRPVRAYMCEHGNWHLTSILLNKYEKRKNY